MTEDDQTKPRRATVTIDWNPASKTLRWLRFTCFLAFMFESLAAAFDVAHQFWGNAAFMALQSLWLLTIYLTTYLTGN
jgi:hypothetical protein